MEHKVIAFRIVKICMYLLMQLINVYFYAPNFENIEAPQWLMLPVVLLLLRFCLVLLPLWESVIVLCFVVRYFMSILVLQSS